MTGRDALTSSRQAFEVVDAFEQAVARYTGAPYCVAVDSGCNALVLVLATMRDTYTTLSLPAKTYVGVAMAVAAVGITIEWRDQEWSGAYQLLPAPVYDSALCFTSDMYRAGTFVCLSFQASKLLPIGRGGAILHDDPAFDKWARRARNNGRAEGALCGKEHGFPHLGWNMWMTPPDAARGLWLLTYYPEHMPDQPNDFDDISGEEIFK
jgi:dTDP-4-amino-4,6-dideoxygalactose transaminase